MINIIQTANNAVSDFVWGVPAMICIVVVGLLVTFRTKFIQFRKFPLAIKECIGRAFSKQTEVKEGAISPFQSLCTALAATVGTGSIAGVAGAIAIGGPGAVFWMWISALLGMATKYAEVTLAVHFREKSPNGELLGGPMFYIKNGLGKRWQWLGILYAVFGIFAVFGTGCATQVNSIASSIDASLLDFGIITARNIKIFNLILGIIMAVIVAFVLIGGVKRIGAITEKLVPVMAVMYVVMGILVVIINFKYVPIAFKEIFIGAFQPEGITGGVVGGFFLSMKKGFSRGIFSNEAGLGTGSMAHATADTTHPARQGLYGIFEVFTATILICTLTALIILTGHARIQYGVAAGAELTIEGLTNTFGSWASILLALAMICFAFSTVLGWGLYGTRCSEFLFGPKSVLPFKLIYALVAIVGTSIDLGLVWGVAETFNGLMSIPNLIAIFLLSGTVVKLTKSYYKGEPYKSDTINND